MISAVFEKIPDLFRVRMLEYVTEFSKKPGYVSSLLLGQVGQSDPSFVSLLLVLDVPGWFNGKQRLTSGTFEIMMKSLDEITRMISIGGDATFMRKIVNAQVIGEEDPRIMAIRDVARVILETGPAPCPKSRRILIRAKYSNIHDELAARIDNEVECAYLQAWALHQIVGDLHRLSRYHLPVPAELLEDLKARNSVGENMIRSVIDARSTEERGRALRELIDFTLKPWGGLAPEEWSAREGAMTIRVWNDRMSAFEEQPMYDAEDYQLPPDAFKIGINEWVAQGQDFEELSSEAFVRNQPIFWWDIPGNTPLPYVNDVVEKVVREYAERKHVLGILVFGSHGYGVRPPRPDSDVDLFVVTTRRGEIQENRVIDGVKLGFQFINFTDLYQGTLQQRETGFWRGLKESKILFGRHPSIPLMQALAAATFQAGMLPLSQRELVLRMDRLETMLEAGDSLLKDVDSPRLLLNDNALFCTAVQDWFRMHRMLDTKRTYVMSEIQQKDPELYCLVAAYLTDWAPSSKHSKLHEIILYIIKPFGGPLPAEWGIPAPPPAATSS